MIESNDDSATMESDDLLQSERAYGGLNEEGGGTYGVTYFPEKGVDPTWELEFDVFEITDIAQGVKTQLALWKCDNSDCRWMFSDPDDTCFHCDYVNVSE